MKLNFRLTNGFDKSEESEDNLTTVPQEVLPVPEPKTNSTEPEPEPVKEVEPKKLTP